MRRIIIFIVAILLSTNLSAQCYVYETTGQVLVKLDSDWTQAYKTMQVQQSTLIKTDRYASIVILDRNNDMLYSFQSTTPQTLESLIKSQNKNSNSLLKEVSQELYNAMFKSNKKSMDAYSYTSGITYRDENVDRYVAQALAYSMSNSDAVSLRIVNMESDVAVSCVKIGELGVVEVTNNTGENLYVNVIDIDSVGNISPIFPMDEYQTMTHLYVPLHSVVRLSGFPIEFYEPRGVDTLVLVAYNKPYNIVNVVNMLQSVTPQNAADVYINSSKITIE